MSEQMPANTVLSEDQPVETGAPSNPTDVGNEFDAMVNGAPKVEPDVAPDELDGDAAPIEELNQETDEQAEPEVEPLAAVPQADPGALAALQAEIIALKAQMEAQANPTVEATIGELTSPFTPRVNDEEVFANRPFLGIAPGTTPEMEFEQALATPQGFNGALNRVRQSAIRDILMLLPGIMNGHLNHRLAEAQADEAFWGANKDLREKMPTVKAIGEHLLRANPNLSKSAYYKMLEDVSRAQLNMPRAATKSGGTQHLPQRGAQPGGQRRPQPTLAGGSSSRRAAPSKDGNTIADTIDAWRRAQ